MNAEAVAAWCGSTELKPQQFGRCDGTVTPLYAFMEQLHKLKFTSEGKYLTSTFLSLELMIGLRAAG